MQNKKVKLLTGMKEIYCKDRYIYISVNIVILAMYERPICLYLYLCMHECIDVYMCFIFRNLTFIPSCIKISLACIDADTTQKHRHKLLQESDFPISKKYDLMAR